MDQAHAILQSAWETGDPAELLVLADFLDERGDASIAELLRLLVADSRTARNAAERARSLEELRAEAWRLVRTTAWPDMAVQRHAGPASFSRRLDADRPGRELILVRPDRGTVHWLLADLDGDDEVVRTRNGREMLRRRLTPVSRAFAARHGIHSGAGFALADDFFPLQTGERHDRAAAVAERQQRVDAALAPAAVQPADLPAELVPHVAWVLCEYLCDRGRLARAGHLVPGAHVFFFRTGPMRWRHQEAVASGASGTDVLRRRFQAFAWRPDRPVEGAVVAAMLVRVDDGGRVTARKLVWAGPGGEVRESATLRRAGDTLAREHFHRVMDELGLDPPGPAGSFVVDTPERLRSLFTGGTGAVVE